MEVGGYNKEPDWVKLGPSLLVASCVILAIRTAKWTARQSGMESNIEMQGEIAYATSLVQQVLGALLARKSALFPMKDVPWHVATDEDVLR